MRVAVSQFASHSNTQENLATCIRMINETAVCKPDLIVLPEYCNTLFYDTPHPNNSPSYADHNQSWNEALTIDGDFLQQIGEQALKHNCFILINITLRRDISRVHHDRTVKSNVSVTSCLYSPDGELIHQQDKQILTEKEDVFFFRGSNINKVVTTTFGKLGFLSGSDSLKFNASRGLALSGAQLLCNSINTFAIDQSKLHDPARSSQNNIFLASANKIGSLVSIEQLDKQKFENDDDKSKTLIAQDYIVGAGCSQITSPEGRVLAKINHNDEGFVFADIDLLETTTNIEAKTAIGLNSKFRPDGTQLIKQLRPELYQEVETNVTQLNQLREAPDKSVPTTANVAIFATYKSNEEAIDDVCHYIENNVSDIIQLPELFFITDKAITKEPEQRCLIANLCQQLIKQVSNVLRPFQYLCTSVIIDDEHQAVIINEKGLFAAQQQLHFCKRYEWTKLGDNVNTIVLPLEQGNIKVSMLTADDANIPEIVNAAALKGAHLLLVPFDIQESCEVEYNLLSSAVENRICIVAASREKSFAQNLPSTTLSNDKKNIYSKNKVKTQKSTGLIINLTTDIALLPQWRARKFNGYINEPLVKYQYGKITKAVIHPIAACK